MATPGVLREAAQQTRLDEIVTIDHLRVARITHATTTDQHKVIIINIFVLD